MLIGFTHNRPSLNDELEMRNWSESLRNWSGGLALDYAVDHLLYLMNASFEVNIEFTLIHARCGHSEERP